MAYRATVVLLIALMVAPVAAQSPKLMLFGGRDHDDYLGCLNCSSVASDSLCNEFGKFGNEFSTDSIWNEFSHYGNEFSSNSPWNEFSTQAPVIVDSEGNFYGYFSRNELHPKRTQIKSLVALLQLAGKMKHREDVRALLCK